jgi:FkbM family methyltransferase
MAGATSLKSFRQRLNLAVGRAIHRTGFELRRVARAPEHSLLGLRSRDIRTILDVGANAGQFARHILGHFPDATVLAFEPVPGPFRDLKALAVSDPRIEALNCAVGDHEGHVEMFEHVDHNYSSSLLRTTTELLESLPAIASQRRIEVPLTTLDHALAGREVVPQLLVKLDVQGFEDRVIRGAAETLRRAEGAIVEVNLDSFYEGQASFRDILGGIEAAGLKFAGALDQVIWGDGHVSHFDAVFLRPRR